jgi:hypothetical protein
MKADQIRLANADAAQEMKINEIADKIIGNWKVLASANIEATMARVRAGAGRIVHGRHEPEDRGS